MNEPTPPLVDDPTGALASSSEEDAARALAERYRLEYVDHASFAHDHEILKSVPVDMMLRYNFLPYRREEGRLILVMADPTDIPVVDELSHLLQTPVQPAVGTPSAIQEALKRGQGTTRVLEQASESFKIQILRDDENGDDVLSIDRIQADASPIIRLIDSTVFDALNRRASDIHIETRDTEVVIKYRIDGVLQAAMKPMAKEHHSTIISRIKVMAELDIAEKRIPQDGRFRVKVRGRSVDFRVSIMPSVHGEDAVIRILDKESLSEQFTSLRLDVLGFDEKELTRFRRFIREPYGMVLVTGPTGSGKTTTVHANNVIDVLGRFLNMKIEPYNFVSALNCVQAQRLVRTICVHCKRKVRASPELLEQSGLKPAAYDDVWFYEGAGCLECGGTGYKGRMAISELLDLSDNVRELILARRSSAEIKRAARAEGMVFLRESAVSAAVAGTTTLHEINKVTFVEVVP